MLVSLIHSRFIAVRFAVVLALLAMAALASGCDENLSGTYQEPAGDSLIEFRANGKAYITMMGATTAGEYEVDGDKVIVKANGQNMVLTLRDNRTTLEGGPLGMKFIKQSK